MRLIDGHSSYQILAFWLGTEYKPALGPKSDGQHSKVERESKIIFRREPKLNE